MRVFMYLASSCFLAACGGPMPDIPPLPAAGAQCQVLDPPGTTPAGQGLAPAPGAAGLPRAIPELLEADAAPTEVQWRALPPTADAELVQIAGQADEAPGIRARALQGVGVRAPDGARDQVIALLTGGEHPVEVRSAAADALVRGYLGEDAEPVLAALGAALADRDPSVRVAVVRALAPVAARTPAARDLLAARLPDETDPRVRAALEQALPPTR